MIPTHTLFLNPMGSTAPIVPLMSEPASRPSRKQNQERNPEWWPTAQALKIQGVPIKEIAAQLNVNYESLRKRFQRAGMSHIDGLIAGRIVQVTSQASEAAQAMAKNSLRPIIHKLSHDLLDSHPLKRKPKSVAQAEQIARVHHTVTQTAKLLEGWNDDANRFIVDVQSIESTTGAEALKALNLAPEAIDDVIDVNSQAQIADGPAQMAIEQPANAHANADGSALPPTLGDGQVATQVDGPSPGS